MSKQYRAYKPVRCTDGITSWVEHTFDNTVAMTPDDIAMAKFADLASAPAERIAAMRENLDSLKNPTPEIKLHADEIRAIYARLSDDFHIKTREEHAAMQKADELWDHIVTLRDLLPKAVTGAAVIAGSKKGGIIRGKQQSREKTEKDEVEIMRGRGNVSDTVKSLARRTDALGDPLELREDLWLQLMGDLFTLGLREVVERNNPHRITYKDGDGKPGEIKFTSFQRMVYAERGKCK